MYLKKLSLINFKQFDTSNFTLDAKVNVFLGINGKGKTNVLDAVYQLSMGKSYFNPIATQNIKHGEDFFVVDGSFFRKERDEHIIISFKKGSKKVVKRNDKIYGKLSEYVGFIPIVIISPSDRNIINEGSEPRRSFVDMVISQSDKKYLNNLIGYDNILSQRNALLKYFAANQSFDKETLSIYDSQMSKLAEQIHAKRKAFIEDFIDIFKHRYEAIVGGKELPEIEYESHLEKDTLTELLELSLPKDRVLQYTSKGIHKDDFKFSLGGYPIKKFGSQGQQKTFFIALKLAQFDFIKRQTTISPILLLDDIFDKLDEDRVAKVISLVSNDEFGQIFITDTHQERTESIVKQRFSSYEIFKL